MGWIVVILLFAVVVFAIAGSGGSDSPEPDASPPTPAARTSSDVEQQEQPASQQTQEPAPDRAQRQAQRQPASQQTQEPAPDRAQRQAQRQQASPTRERSTPTRSNPSPRAKTTQEKINDCLYRARLDFERQIRDRLNDPDSMKTRLPTRHGTTVYLRNEVRFELDYTARNLFGGTQRATAVGMMNIDTCRVRPLSYGE